MVNIYVIIVTYNGMKWIDKCLKSVLHTTIPLQVLVIDNLSTDGTINFVKENYPIVNLIETGQNLGFGKANNIGLKKVIENKADYVFLLNQDAYVMPDTIEGLINIYHNNPSFGILSPVHLNGDGSSLDYNFSAGCNVIDCPGLLPDIYLNQAKEIYSANFVNAALWLIPMKCILKVGVFDPFFPHYGEDVDYVNRLKYFGYKIGICPAYKGYHDRESRPESRNRNYAIWSTTYIYMMKDINKKTGKAIISAFSLLFKHTIASLLKLDMKFLIENLKIFFVLLFSVSTISSDRRKAKQEGAFING